MDDLVRLAGIARPGNVTVRPDQQGGGRRGRAFGDHPIDQAMKRQAIEALAAVRDDLRELASDQPPVVASA